MNIDIISIYPDMFNVIFNYGVTKKAINKKLLKLKCWDLRSFSLNKRRSVDDKVYGGGGGMLISFYPLQKAIYSVKKRFFCKTAKVIYLSPQGRKMNHKGVVELSKNNWIIIVCGRYEGVDERFIISEVDEEWSIGDYVLSGGELAAMVLIDSISRLIPGVLNKQISYMKDSFFYGLLDFPNYTRPKLVSGMNVPSVLLSGDHQKINRWRLKKSLGYTWLKRPDLLDHVVLNEEEVMLLTEFQCEYFRKK